MQPSKNSKIQLLQKIVLFLAKTPGRDQSCRLIQYFFMFLGNIIKKEQSAKKLLAVGSQMSQTRKILRFGRPLGITLTILNNLKGLFLQIEKDPFNKNQNIGFVLSSVISLTFTNLYFITDHILWLCNIGVIQNEKLKKTTDWYSDYFWIWESVFGVISIGIDIYLLKQKIQGLIDEGAENWQVKVNQIQYQIRQCKKDFIKILLNIPMAYGFVYGTISRKNIGILGTITSLIGCHQVWTA